jgi:hypothetical protein
VFGAGVLARRLAEGAASAAVCATTGIGAEPARDAQGRPLGGRLVHVARDTSFGCVLRSHFWIGHDLAGAAEPAQIAALSPDALGFGLLRHAYNEMTCLAGLLPGLYAAENRERERPVLPWEV